MFIICYKKIIYDLYVFNNAIPSNQIFFVFHLVLNINIF